jgi:catechol 2,3-dioxygenase-like lactoylglutathione lyase family enzyme
MARYKFHHMSLLAGERDLAERCERFYLDHFGLKIMAPAGDTDESSFSFLTDHLPGEMPPLEIVGDVYDARETDFLKKHGTGIDHICFEVEDLDRVGADLSRAGVPFHIPIYDFLGMRIAWCKDPAGTEVELIEGVDSYLPQAQPDEPYVSPARLDHVSILTGSRELAAATERFYRERLEMTVARRGDPGNRETDWVNLEDASGTNPFRLEVIGETISDTERRFLKRHGPGMDHFCFDVQDVSASCKRLQEKGVGIEIPLTDYYGIHFFYLRDPLGVLVQVRQAMGD